MKSKNNIDKEIYSAPTTKEAIEELAFKTAMSETPEEEFKLDLIKILTKATQKDMKNVALIEGYDGINGYTYQSMTYKFLLGNRGEPCEDKIKFGQEYDDLPEDRKLLWKWEEL